MNRATRQGIGLLCAVIAAAGAEESPRVQNATTPSTVEYVDLERYAGLWYEIARIPNGFQDQCARNVTAQYALRDDGKIEVINRCIESDGSVDEARGLARVRDTDSNARLEVSFFSILGWRPVWGDYWIIGLGEDYDYALVGSPDRKYGWVLTREPMIREEMMSRLFDELRAQGYDPAQFEMTPQQ